MEPKARFASIGQNTISVWMLVLLFIQVILSALVIKRLNDLDQSIADLQLSNKVNVQANQPEPPVYVENVSYQIRIKGRDLSISGPPMKTSGGTNEFRMVLKPIAALALD